MAPPSLHAAGRRYDWFPGWGPDDQAVRPAPDWLLMVLREPAHFGASRQLHRTETSYGRALFEREIGRVAIAPVGKRNCTLNKAAFVIGQLIAGRALEDVPAAVQALFDVGQAIGLGHEEVVATVRSGIDAGSLQPRRARRRLAS